MWHRTIKRCRELLCRLTYEICMTHTGEQGLQVFNSAVLCPAPGDPKYIVVCRQGVGCGFRIRAFTVVEEQNLTVRRNNPADEFKAVFQAGES